MMVRAGQTLVPARALRLIINGLAADRRLVFRAILSGHPIMETFGMCLFRIRCWRGGVLADIVWLRSCQSQRCHSHLSKLVTTERLI